MSGSGTNFIAFACGMKRSGKSHLLDTLASKFPRRIIFDFIGEYDAAISERGFFGGESVAECVDLLKHAHKTRTGWTVCAMLTPEQVPELLGAIMHKQNPFSRAVGGVVVQCGEVDLIAPNHAGISTEVRNVFQRGRHFDVSALVATQRPRDVHRVVTSQSDILCAFRQHEPRDADFLGDIMRSDATPLVKTLGRFEYVRYMVNYGRLDIVSADGSVRETIPAP